MENPNKVEAAPVEGVAGLATSLPKDVLDAIMSARSGPNFYFNGFVLAPGTADVTIVLRRNNEAVATLNCSFTVAKTLSKIIGDSITALETMSQQKILTTEDIARLINERPDAK